MRIRFRFRAIPFVATVLLVALGIALGQWQDRRAAGKIAMQEQLAARAQEAPLLLGPQPVAAPTFQRVRVRGSFVQDWPVFLDNRPQGGRAGFYLLMPLRIAGSDLHVLVARGWLPRHAGEYGRLPPFDTPAGEVTLEGVAKESMGKVMQLGTPTPLAPKSIVQNVSVGQFAASSGLKLQPFFIEQTDPARPGEQLVRDWPAPALGADKHKGYAFQWYALALMALLFFVITGFRRGSKQND
ncbi:SURF1 family protein [Massilia glaciei]|uniref:SURF1-like protein n=1 Tax=Massilia glaciei TaxID=1524097 RepID=A0A2U2HKB4_9BURK|nr:SURF1 family protein [Massilia glaciei]PWF47885.1 SURF1 family protein [Massilia glaciei]